MLSADVMAQKIQTADSQQTLGGVDDDAVRTEPLKNLAQMVLVLFFRGAGNKDVIHVEMQFP